MLLDGDWGVVAGDESKEMEAENQRELRVLEAFYPGASAIPPNPSVTADVENSDCDDQQTIGIPILPVEDDDITMDSASGVDVATEPSITDENTSSTSTLPAGPEIMAALSAISKSKELGSSVIDQDLLIKILSNPKLMENLVANCDVAGSVSSNASSRYPSSTNEADGVVTTTPANTNGQYYPQSTATHIPPVVYPPSSPSDQTNYGAPPAREASYYKNLIQQHGGERQEALPVQHLDYRHNLQPGGRPNPEMVNSNNNNNNNQRPRDSKPKIMKLCKYFNGPRGCRNGSNCPFQHTATTYQPRNLNNGNMNNSEMKNSKRMRFDRD